MNLLFTLAAVPFRTPVASDTKGRIGADHFAARRGTWRLPPFGTAFTGRCLRRRGLTTGVGRKG